MVLSGQLQRQIDGQIYRRIATKHLALLLHVLSYSTILKAAGR